MQDKTLTLKVVRREAHTNEIAVIELGDPEGVELPAFEAGAHIDMHLGEGLVRQYSLSNAPGKCHRYRLGVLLDPASRGGSRAVHERLHEGVEIEVGAPRNHFPLAESASYSLLVGGGIGITPMIAMAYALQASGCSFELHYCCRSRDKAAFVDELESQFGEALVLHFDDGPTSQILDPESLFAAQPSDAHLYVCGPAGFMDWVIGSADKVGWPKSRVHSEYFTAEVDTSGVAFEVEAAVSGVVVQVEEGMSIAQALKTAGVKVNVSCEEGVCGTCICDVLEGIPDHRDQFLSDEEKEDNDQIAVCCSRAKSSRLVIDI
ncbi:PDR/VanB family oxidoreductase [Halomonas sp. McH1-25]|uniref:PDR/VanB family oxidoreductase n=1 Tax=unclassified Halomonas TaxID=2609666 RepID=UPI001EF468CD|nr:MULTISPECIES: PDR/VanB family oxidoreductase [unclassified Halomonas]MCG7602182.1 PDR/VanB family oxidoreductase [Halomonas sp. McH1-25]MCP1344678.1 PDR/VanB family oxidoreductase [Halomonas sp. FL8]MCP1362483.1 PDR/VanB family oxidoreductase [Halomonas sp. BBD45]MCP1365204.1 PDR/VanB family oxidoreductase [Halomonas sp. BBD48]